MASVVNNRNNKVIATHLEKAETLKSRLVGLIGRPTLPEGHGLWISRSGNSIHTFFMRFPIDVVFVNKKGEVKYVAHNVHPWKMIFAPLLVQTDCLELPAGTILKTDTRIGDVVRVEA